MTVRNSYQIVKLFNSLCVSAPLGSIELAKAQSRKEKNESILKIEENNLSYEIVLVTDSHIMFYIMPQKNVRMDVFFVGL
jgi:hypothetical protein